MQAHVEFFRHWCKNSIFQLQAQHTITIFVVNTKYAGLVSSMIPSARTTIPPVAITIVTWKLLHFVRFWKVLKMTCMKIVITTGKVCGSAEWIKKYINFPGRGGCSVFVWCYLHWGIYEGLQLETRYVSHKGQIQMVTHLQAQGSNHLSHEQDALTKVWWFTRNHPNRDLRKSIARFQDEIFKCSAEFNEEIKV